MSTGSSRGTCHATAWRALTHHGRHRGVAASIAVVLATLVGLLTSGAASVAANPGPSMARTEVAAVGTERSAQAGGLSYDDVADFALGAHGRQVVAADRQGKHPARGDTHSGGVRLRVGLELSAPGGLADDVIRRADANLTGSGETVLGHYADDYIGVAQQRGASYFDIGDAWDGLSDAQRWAANQRVLDTAIANGDRISLVTARSNIRYPSALADEIQYLTSNGYTWVDDVTLVPG